MTSSSLDLAQTTSSRQTTCVSFWRRCGRIPHLDGLHTADKYATWLLILLPFRDNDDLFADGMFRRICFAIASMKSGGTQLPIYRFPPSNSPAKQNSCGKEPNRMNCSSEDLRHSLDTGNSRKKSGCRPRNYTWAELMRRVWSMDVLQCPRCGRRMRILSAINPPEAIQKILNCLGLPSRPPPIARALLEGMWQLRT